MRILYFFPTDFPNAHSHSIQALNTAHAMAAQGARVELVVDKLHLNAAETLAQYGLAPHPNLILRTFAPEGSALNRWSGRAFRWAARALVMQRRVGGPLVVYARGTARTLRLIDALAPLCKILRVPVVYEVHGMQYLDLRETHGGRYGGGEELERAIAARRALERRAYKRLSGALCISTRLRELMAEHFDYRGPVIIAPSGVKPPAEIPPPLASREFDAAYIGTLHGFNGVDLLIEALAQCPGLRAAIVGEGGAGNPTATNPEERAGDLEKMKSLARGLGVEARVVFAGRVGHAEALAWMRRAKILVAPGRATAALNRAAWCSPGKVFEYMAGGGAIAASDLPNLRDALEHERNALLFAPNDAASLAAAMRRLASEPEFAQRLAGSAYQDAADFTFPSRATSILEFLKLFHARR